MNSIDLTKLNYKRLQKYRKSLTNKCHRYESCWCGDSGCDFNKTENKNNPHYLELKQEFERVLAECSKRNKVLAQKRQKRDWAHVPTVKEYIR